LHRTPREAKAVYPSEYGAVRYVTLRYLLNLIN